MSGVLASLLCCTGVTDHAQRRETTYVHCKAGRGRSTTVVLCYLVSCGIASVISSIVVGRDLHLQGKIS